jgi:fumarate hydratase class II
MNALTDAEMMAAFGALSADRKELIFTCLQMLLEEQHEDERAWQTGSRQQRPRP